MAARFVTLAVLLACILLLGMTFYQVVAPFLLPLFLAAILSILCQPVYQLMLTRTGNRPSLAAGLTTAMVMVILVTPLALGTFLGAVELTRLSQNNFQDWDWTRGLEQLGTQFVDPALKKITASFPNVMTDADLAQMKKDLPARAKDLAGDLVGKTFFLASSSVGTLLSLLVSGGMFLVALYYSLADGPGLLAAAESLIPLPAEHQRKMCNQFSKVVRAVVLATFLAAFAQGIATAVALQVVGMGHFFVFLIAATIASLVPLAGTWIVWGPCAAWLAFQGHWGAAMGLALFGIIVVGLLDNVVRTYVLNSDAQLHPLLAFVSVLGALQVIGLWGVFFGPIVASCLYALVQIFNTELKEMTAINHLTKTEPAVGEMQQVVLPNPSTQVVVAPVVAAPPPTASAAKTGQRKKS